MIVIELPYSVVFPVAQTLLSTSDENCAYGSAHIFSHVNYMKPSCILPHPRLCFVRIG
jgi:hypothetical protein